MLNLVHRYINKTKPPQKVVGFGWKVNKLKSFKYINHACIMKNWLVLTTLRANKRSKIPIFSLLNKKVLQINQPPQQQVASIQFQHPLLLWLCSVPATIVDMLDMKNVKPTKYLCTSHETHGDI